MLGEGASAVKGNKKRRIHILILSARRQMPAQKCESRKIESFYRVICVLFYNKVLPSQSLCVAARMPRGDRGSGGSRGSRCRGGTFLALVNVTVRLWLGGGLG